MAADDLTRTYRNHPVPSSFDRVRGDVVRRVMDLMGGRTPTSIYNTTGIKIRPQDKYQLNEADLFRISDNRLFLLAEKLGLRFDITVQAA